MKKFISSNKEGFAFLLFVGACWRYATQALPLKIYFAPDHLLMIGVTVYLFFDARSKSSSSSENENDDPVMRKVIIGSFIIIVLVIGIFALLSESSSILPSIYGEI